MESSQFLFLSFLLTFLLFAFLFLLLLNFRLEILLQITAFDQVQVLLKCTPRGTYRNGFQVDAFHLDAYT